MGDHDELERAYRLATDFLDGLAERHVGPETDADGPARRARRPAARDRGGRRPTSSRRSRPAPIPASRRAPARATSGSSSAAPLPAALAADWLTSAWDQNASLYAISPAAAVVEEVGGGWILDLLDLPRGTATGFVTGATMANLACLAAARHARARPPRPRPRPRRPRRLPARDGGGRGRGARVGARRAAPARASASGSSSRVADRPAGTGRPRGLRRRRSPPSTGLHRVRAGGQREHRRDRRPARPRRRRQRGRRLAPRRRRVRHLGPRRAVASRTSPPAPSGADSWATDGHKWLNVPYDCGVAIVRDPAALEAAVGIAAAYLARPADGARDPAAWTPELSRRGRAFPVWAALRSLGREGVVDLVGRTCELAERFAARLGAVDGVRVLNDVVLNQALVRFEGADGGGGRRPHAPRDRARAGRGTCWLGGTVWHGMAAMRISVPAGARRRRTWSAAPMRSSPRSTPSGSRSLRHGAARRVPIASSLDQEDRMRIMVAYDGSDPAKRALERAAALHGEHEITVLSVVPVLSGAGAAAASTRPATSPSTAGCSTRRPRCSPTATSRPKALEAVGHPAEVDRRRRREGGASTSSSSAPTGTACCSASRLDDEPRRRRTRPCDVLVVR